MQATTAVSTPQTKIDGQFAIVPAWIQDHPAIDAIAEAVYSRLARAADYATWVVRKLGLHRLAALVGFSVPTIKSRLDRLKEIGAVTWRRGGFGLTNEYRLHPNRRDRQRQIAFDGPPPEPAPPEAPENSVCKPACSQSASPVATIQNPPQKPEGTAPSSPAKPPTRKRDAKALVRAMKRAGELAGFKVVTRRRDVSTVAHRMAEYGEPFEVWREVYEWLFDHREALTPFQKGCLASPVQLASQLGAIAGDMQGSRGYHEWRANRSTR